MQWHVLSLSVMFIEEYGNKTEQLAAVFVQLCMWRKIVSESSIMLSFMISTDPDTVLLPAEDIMGLVKFS